MSSTRPPTFYWFAPSRLRTLRTASLLGIPYFCARENRLVRALVTHKPTAAGDATATLVLASEDNESSPSPRWMEAAVISRLPPHTECDIKEANVLDEAVLGPVANARVRFIVEVQWKRYLVCIGGPDVSTGFHNFPMVAGESQVVVELPPAVNFERVEAVKGAGSSKVDGSKSAIISNITPRCRSLRAALFGQNRVVAPNPSFSSVFLSALSRPFFIFQLFACILWVFEEYVLYAAAILLISVGGAAAEAAEIRAATKRLSALANPRGATASDEALVPGDEWSVSRDTVVPADCEVLEGSVVCNEASITGEAAPVRKWATVDGNARCMFAGSIVLSATRGARAVVTRTGVATLRGQLVRDILVETDLSGPNGHLVDEGEGREDRTGIGSDAYSALKYMVAFGLVGALWATLRLMRLGLSFVDATVEALDLITIAVPPALPAAVSFGLAFAIARMAAVGVSCVRSSAVPFAGEAEVVVFDKTGTLTSQDLSLQGAYEAVNGLVACVTSRPEDEGGDGFPLSTSAGGAVLTSREVKKYEDSGLNSFQMSSLFRLALGCCHSLSVVDERVVGDEVDRCLFELSGYAIRDCGAFDGLEFTIHPQGSPVTGKVQPEAGVKRIFEFSPALARQGAIAVVGEGGTSSPECAYFVFVKGAPEAIVPLCRVDSVPQDFWEFVQHECALGRRVITLAYRDLTDEGEIRDVGLSPRGVYERNLTLLGLVSMENRLKPMSRFVVGSCTTAGLRSIMCSGDHLDTCIAVARSAGMVREDDAIVRVQLEDYSGDDASSSLIVLNPDDNSRYPSVQEAVRAFRENNSSRVVIAAVGDAVEVLHDQVKSGVMGLMNEELNLILIHGVVFARMAPAQKQMLVELLETFREGAKVNNALRRYLRTSAERRVLFVGDGANDVGALKAAAAGVAVAEEAESKLNQDVSVDDISVPAAPGYLPIPAGVRVRKGSQLPASASFKEIDGMSDYSSQKKSPSAVGEASLGAPFTTLRGISGVLDVLRQARAARVASLAAVLYLMMSSAVQFSCVLLLQSFGAFKLSDSQFLVGDLGIVMPLAVATGRTGASFTLFPKPVPRRLSSRNTLRTLFILIAIQVIEQLVMLVSLPTGRSASSESVGRLESKTASVTAMFILSSAQYVIVAVASQLCTAHGHRRPLRTNMTAVTIIAVDVILCVVLLHMAASPNKWWLAKWLEMAFLSFSQRFIVGFVIVSDAIATLGIAVISGNE